MSSPTHARTQLSRDDALAALAQASLDLENLGWAVEGGELTARTQRLVLTRARRWRRRTERVEVIAIDGGTMTRTAPSSDLQPRTIETLWRRRPGESTIELLQRLGDHKF